uniref:Uncharacterized protein n=1 Tax=Panagrolaimus sp. PS1159 TaxID=55785 RepID=A0AC35FPK7_9BILA
GALIQRGKTPLQDLFNRLDDSVVASSDVGTTESCTTPYMLGIQKKSAYSEKSPNFGALFD